MMSPKERFLSSKNDSEFLFNIVADSRFQRALDAALLQMEWGAQSLDDQQAGSARYNRMCGARDYIQALLTLPEVAKPQPKIQGNLKH